MHERESYGCAKLPGVNVRGVQRKPDAAAYVRRPRPLMYSRMAGLSVLSFPVPVFVDVAGRWAGYR
jgi:hypothetical protein